MMISDQKILEKFLQDKLPYYLDLLNRLVQVNSFTANPQGVNQNGKIVAELFRELDFQPEFVQSDNPNFGRHLFLRRPSTKASSPSVAMISHLDTVFSPEEELQNDFSWRKLDDRIYGPGTVDIKGGTIMCYMILDALKELAPQQLAAVNWFIGLDASEEALSDDFGRHCRSKLPADTLACLVFEGGTISEGAFPLVVSRKGRATFGVDVEGRSAHAGNSHYRGANAILQLAHTIQTISAFTDYKKEITFNVGKVKGGSVVNRVPHSATALIEMRAFSSQVFEDGVTKMLALDGSSQISSADGFPCSVSVQLLQMTAPWQENTDTQTLYHIWQQTGSALGYKIKPEKRGGLSDGNMLWDTIPVLDGLGPSGANAHCSERTLDGSKDQEYVLISSFVPKAVLNTLAIDRLVDAAYSPS